MTMRMAMRTTIRLPVRLRCALIWLSVFLVIVLLLAAIIVPWFQRLADLDAGIATASDQLLRYRRLIQTQPALRDELARVRGNQAFRDLYFDAPTPALAGAQVQRQAQEIVTAASGQLISTQILPEQTGEQPPRIRVRAQIQGATETLVEILHRLDQARPFLFVEQVSIRSSARADLPAPEGAARPARRPPANPLGELTIRLDIFGFALGKDT